MHGFSRDYLDAASRISDLSHSLHSPLPSTPPQTPSPFTATPESFLSIYAHLESTRSQLISLETDPTFRSALLARLALASHADQLDGHFRFADCCYFACHVYLAKTVAVGQELGEEATRFLYGGLDALGKGQFALSRASGRAGRVHERTPSR